jgi:hypothetical protein
MVLSVDGSFAFSGTSPYVNPAQVRCWNEDSVRILLCDTTELKTIVGADVV